MATPRATATREVPEGQALTHVVADDKYVLACGSRRQMYVRAGLAALDMIMLSYLLVSNFGGWENELGERLQSNF